MPASQFATPYNATIRLWLKTFQMSISWNSLTNSVLQSCPTNSHISESTAGKNLGFWLSILSIARLYQPRLLRFYGYTRYLSLNHIYRESLCGVYTNVGVTVAMFKWYVNSRRMSLTSPAHIRPTLFVPTRSIWYTVGHIVLPVGVLLVRSIDFTLSTSSMLGIFFAAVMRAL